MSPGGATQMHHSVPYAPATSNQQPATVFLQIFSTVMPEISESSAL
jgi:hypothetical protein